MLSGMFNYLWEALDEVENVRVWVNKWCVDEHVRDAWDDVLVLEVSWIIVCCDYHIDLILLCDLADQLQLILVSNWGKENGHLLLILCESLDEIESITVNRNTLLIAEVEILHLLANRLDKAYLDQLLMQFYIQFLQIGLVTHTEAGNFLIVLVENEDFE